MAGVLTRRQMLAGSAAIGLAGAGSGALIATLTQRAGQAGPPAGDPAIQLPSLNNPVSWPVLTANPPIADHLAAERAAVLRVLSRPGRISSRCLTDFARAHRCHVELTTFTSPGQARTAIAGPGPRYDVALGLPVSALGQLVTGRLLQPLNHRYLPRVATLWPEVSNPFYDQNLHYTLPYLAFTTGIGWRRDLVGGDPYALTDGWSFLAQSRYRGRVAILDDYRESVSLGLMSSGYFDLSTHDPRELDQAAASLRALAALTKLRIGNDAGPALAAGRTWIHHSWSGDIVAAAQRLEPGLAANAIGYWFPQSGIGPVGTDVMAVPRRAASPVLAHLFLNSVLDRPNAIANVAATGYTQPLRWLTPELLARLGIVPDAVVPAIVRPANLRRGLRELPLPWPAQQLWQQAWQSATSGT